VTGDVERLREPQCDGANGFFGGADRDGRCAERDGWHRQRWQQQTVAAVQRRGHLADQHVTAVQRAHVVSPMM
jgi:hypothetical protein